ncbi:hypothetical protein RHMOL_Rhmol07G0224500 [Rhododendron molle]|nr:hypothetical protein RHMOL_Rhmol07G0224500 [Rhododendron molle]
MATGYWPGYHGRVHCSSSLEAELWRIYKGLEIILEKKLENVQIEVDSLIAVNLIKEGDAGAHPQSVVTIGEAHYVPHASH